MAARSAIPTRLLLTDERLGGSVRSDPLWMAIAGLPRGGAVVLRHYSWPAAARRRLALEVAAVARRRRLLLFLTPGLEGLRADGWHWPRWARGRPPAGGFHSRPAHDARGLHLAAAAGADLVLLSPVFATRSHAGGRVLGVVRFGLLARHSPIPVLALGGMSEVRYARLAAVGAAGYAAIDGWLAA